jgi:hypothetical protein
MVSAIPTIEEVIHVQVNIVLQLTSITQLIFERLDFKRIPKKYQMKLVKFSVAFEIYDIFSYFIILVYKGKKNVNMYYTMIVVQYLIAYSILIYCSLIQEICTWTKCFK